MISEATHKKQELNDIKHQLFVFLILSTGYRNPAQFHENSDAFNVIAPNRLLEDMIRFPFYFYDPFYLVVRVRWSISTVVVQSNQIST